MRFTRQDLKLPAPAYPAISRTGHLQVNFEVDYPLVGAGVARYQPFQDI